jgi:hypothetical protein
VDNFLARVLGDIFGRFLAVLGGSSALALAPRRFFHYRPRGRARNLARILRFFEFFRVFGAVLGGFVPDFGLLHPCHIHTFMLITSTGRA